MWRLLKNLIKVFVFVYAGLLLFFASAAFISNLQLDGSDAREAAGTPPAIDESNGESSSPPN